MKSLYGFLVKPIGERYNNIKKIGDKELVLNTEMFNHQYINREARVLSVPKIGKTDIKVGDTVIVHHNVFRRWENVKGIEKNSKSYINKNLYIVYTDQIFLYKRKNEWITPKGYCFVQPIKETDEFNIETEKACRGVVLYSDGSVNTGSLVGFTPFSTYEFIIDGIRLYRVLSKFITIKYEYQGNEETYNPSWAQSG
jgi:hypothetical protein